MPFLVPWGVCVDDTQSDRRRNIQSRSIRGPVNPVKDGRPLATWDVDWQNLSLLEFRACHACSKVYDRCVRPCLSHAASIKTRPSVGPGLLLDQCVYRVGKIIYWCCLYCSYQHVYCFDQNVWWRIDTVESDDICLCLWICWCRDWLLCLTKTATMLLLKLVIVNLLGLLQGAKRRWKTSIAATGTACMRGDSCRARTTTQEPVPDGRRQLATMILVFFLPCPALMLQSSQTKTRVFVCRQCLGL